MNLKVNKKAKILDDLDDVYPKPMNQMSNMLIQSGRFHSSVFSLVLIATWEQCSLFTRLFGLRFSLSNPLTQTYPAYILQF